MSHDASYGSCGILQVTVVDNFFTGRRKNLEHWLVLISVVLSDMWIRFFVLSYYRIGHENFELLNHDVVNPLMIEGSQTSPLSITSHDP